MQRPYQLSGIAPIRVGGELAALLARKGRRQYFTAGSLIQQQGDASDGFWLIEAGAVTICRFDADGGITAFAVLGAGDLFGELAHFAGVPRQVDAVAESDAVLIRIDARLVERLLAEEPEFARWLLRSLASQLRMALDRIDRDRNLSAEARMIRVLVDLAGREREGLALTQQELGELIGTSRITAGQILRRFAKAGLVRLEYRRIVVIDHAALAALAD